MSALSDARRLKLLKILSRRALNQSELSKISGIKGGSFKHHIDGLKEGRFVYQEETRGRYLITQLGVEALKLSEILYKRYKYESTKGEFEPDREVENVDIDYEDSHKIEKEEIEEQSEGQTSLATDDTSDVTDMMLDD